MASIPSQRTKYDDQSALGLLSSGVWPIQSLRRAVEKGVVTSGNYYLPEQRFQPASIDLHLGETAYRLRCSFLPGDSTVKNKLNDYVLGPPLDLRTGAILERNRPYLIPLMEQVNLPEGVRARANPKSSTGRLDVFTRVISDKSERFDEVAEGRKTPLYLEVVSRTFTIFVTTGLALNQLRLVSGDDTTISKLDMLRTHKLETPLVYYGFQDAEPQLDASGGLILSVDLAGTEDEAVAYRAKPNSKLLDMTKIGHYEPGDFWERIIPESGNRIVLEPEDFYLLVSREQVSIPPHYAAEMTAFDPTSGEIRTHYAGFFDPGFGYSTQRELAGSRAVLEVRAHDVPFVLEHGQAICKLEFSRMLETPNSLYGTSSGASYQGQGLALSKHFNQRKKKGGTAPQYTLFPVS